MKKIYFLLSIICLIAFSSCKKETSTPPDFSEITVTDSSCIYISDVDTTDWTNDVVWTTQETNLLNFADTTIVITDSVEGFIQLSAACPNPSAGVFFLGVNTQRETKMKLVCVNTEMEVLYFTTRKFTGGPILTAYDFTGISAFRANENYRVYYAFYTSKGVLYYKGHGDLRIE